MVHCASANRVGAFRLAHRVLDADQSWDAVMAEAKSLALLESGRRGHGHPLMVHCATSATRLRVREADLAEPGRGVLERRPSGWTLQGRPGGSCKSRRVVDRNPPEFK